MKMKRNIISQIYASVLVNAIYAMRNYPITFVSTLLAPLSILLIITFISNGKLLSVAVEGALLTTMVTSGIGLQTDLSHLKNDFKLQDMVVSSPTTSFIYMVGMAISEIIYSLPALLVILILFYYYVSVTFQGALVLIGVYAVMFAFSIALGFLLSTMTSDIVQNWAFSGILSTILTAIPPIYYQITYWNYLPVPFRYLPYLSPTTYAAEIAQNAIGALPLSTMALMIDWIVIIIVSIAIFIVAAKKNKWREP
jgi:ABC-2 type transport system permease protein